MKLVKNIKEWDDADRKRIASILMSIASLGKSKKTFNTLTYTWLSSLALAIDNN